VHEFSGEQQEPEFIMSPEVTQSSLVGQVLGEKYRIEYQVGQGGFGIVYCATHIGLGKPRAVKVLRQISEDRQRRLELEARALAELDHPYIVAVVDVGVTEGESPYLVMEYVEGKSLGDIITIEGKLSLPRTLAVMKCVCSAVHFAHEHGIIHRDLKPSNIIVQRFSGEGEIAKVLDFGLAKFLQQYAPDRAAGPTTESGMILGTVEYLSPEQCSGQPIDARSDIYALGVILYQMLTGTVPFRGDTPFAILTQHINAPPPRVRDVCSELPASVERVVCRAMAKDPAKRQQTALELRDELERAVLHPDRTPVEETEEIPATLRFSSQEVGSWGRRLWNAKVIMGVVGLLLVAFSALHFYPGREAAPQPWVLPDLTGWRETFTLTPTGQPNAIQWNAPPTWKIVPGEEAKGDGALLVQGPALGTLRLPDGTALYNFGLAFMVTIQQGKKLAWALRIQHPEEYYFFELTFPESDQESAQFQGYVYNPDYEQPRPFSPYPKRLPDFGPPQEGDVYLIEVITVGHRFIYKFSRTNDRVGSYIGPYKIELEPDPRDCKYSYGTIGFGNLSEGEAIKIEYVQINNLVPSQNQPAQ